MTTQEGQRGQVLLIVIMLLATVLTVVISIAFKGTTDTQITKLEEENQKALAAAEAGIEKLLADNSTSLVLESIPASVGTGISGSVTLDTVPVRDFVSPIVQRDHQYAFYMGDYTPGTGFGAASYSGNVEIYYGTSSTTDCSTVSLELNQISGNAAPYTVARRIADESGRFGSSTDESSVVLASPTSINGVNFFCRSDVTVAGNAKLLIVRVFNGSSKIGLRGIGNDLKTQGKTILSTAKTATGVTKKVELFQSYPQFLSEFFITSF